MAMKIRPPEKADVTALLRNLFLRTEQELIREITRKRAAGHVEYAEVAGAGPEDPSEHGGHLLELCASDDRKDLLSLG